MKMLMYAYLYIANLAKHSRSMCPRADMFIIILKKTLPLRTHRNWLG